MSIRLNGCADRRDISNLDSRREGKNLHVASGDNQEESGGRCTEARDGDNQNRFIICPIPWHDAKLGSKSQK